MEKELMKEFAYKELVLAVVRGNERRLLPLGEIDYKVIDSLIVAATSGHARKEKILRMRFGLDGKRFKLIEISNTFDLSLSVAQKHVQNIICELQQPALKKFFEALFSVVDFRFKDSPLLNEKIETLNLCNKAMNILTNEGIKNIRQLVNLTPERLIDYKSMGKATIGDIEKKLKAVGLKLR